MMPPRESHGPKNLLRQHAILAEAKVILLSFTCGLAPLGGFFSLAFDARLFVMFSAPGFGQNAILLNLAVETLQRSFKRVIFADFNF
jgi:hypothetical protein